MKSVRSLALIFISIILFSFCEAFGQNESERSRRAFDSSYYSYLEAVRAAELAYDSLYLKPEFGVYANYVFNIYSANFGKLPGVPSCCPAFTGGVGPGLSVGLVYEQPMDRYFDRPIELSARLGYSTFFGDMTSPEKIDLIIDGSSYLGTFEHKLNFNLAALTFDIDGGYNVWRDLRVRAGLSAGLVAHTNYDQLEEIVDPSDRGTFANGMTTRNESEGDIPDASSAQFGFKLGASYDFPLNEEGFLIASPEIFYSYNFIPVVSGIDWNIHSIMAGVSVKFRQPPPPPPPPPPPAPPLEAIPPAPPEIPTLAASIDAVQIDSTGKEIQNPSVKIEDFISLNMRPLLNYIFFDEGSAEIPPRYIRLAPSETIGFDMVSLQNLDAMQTYYNLMNIVGKRLSGNPGAKITIIGCNSDQGVEENNRELSRKRAEAVRDYLRDVWGIPENRMRVEARDKPRNAASNEEEGGDEENRRVEIESNDWTITEPVITIDTLRRISESTIVFKPKIDAEVGVRNWKIDVTQGSEEMVSFAGKGAPESDSEWLISEDSPNAPKHGGTVFYSLKAVDSLGRSISTEKKPLPVDRLSIDKKRLRRIADKEYEYYSLILFDYGEANLEREHRRVVDFVKNRITDESQVIIAGYTDRIGEAEINKRIALRRARAVASRLKINNAEVLGVGEDELLYDNSLPEGRFYCRTVRITIETPVRDR